MTMLSLIVCSYQAPKTLFDTLKTIFEQEQIENTETILVNNGFSEHREQEIYAYVKSLKPGAKFQITREEKPGLGFARQKGFSVAQGQYFVLLDDDNTLGEGFISALLEACKRYPLLGGACPIVEPIWEERPQDWIVDVGRWSLSYNAAENYRSDIPSVSEQYWPPEQAQTAVRPPGGGMVIHRTVGMLYLQNVTDPKRIALSKGPNYLGGCEDEDIWSGVIKLKLGVLYSAQLRVYHYVPKFRTEFAYLIRRNYHVVYSYSVFDHFRDKPRKSYFVKDTVHVARRFIYLSGKAWIMRHKPFRRCLLEFVRDVAVMLGHLHRT